MPEIHWLAVVVATVASFAVGALWYSPLLFMKAWTRGSGLTEETLKSGHQGMVFGLAILANFLATIVFAMFLGPGISVAFGAAAGFACGLFWVTGYFAINYLFERRSLTLFLVNGGYNVAAFTVMGAVLGAMQ